MTYRWVQVSVTRVHKVPGHKRVRKLQETDPQPRHDKLQMKDNPSNPSSTKFLHHKYKYRPQSSTFFACKMHIHNMFVSKLLNHLARHTTQDHTKVRTRLGTLSQRPCYRLVPRIGQSTRGMRYDRHTGNLLHLPPTRRRSSPNTRISVPDQSI